MTIKINSEIIEVNFTTEYFECIEQILFKSNGFYASEIINYIKEYYSNMKNSITFMKAVTKDQFEFFKSDLNQLKMIIEIFKQNLHTKFEVVNE